MAAFTGGQVGTPVHLAQTRTALEAVVDTGRPCVDVSFMAEDALALLEEMGFTYHRSDEYVAANGQTRLVDITTHPSDLRAPAVVAARRYRPPVPASRAVLVGCRLRHT